MNLNESSELTQKDPKSIHRSAYSKNWASNPHRVDSYSSKYSPLKMYDEWYVSREVKKGIYEINLPASDHSGLSVITRCLRNAYVVKYRHMMITWKTPIMILSKELGRNVAFVGKYVLGVIRDIYWIGRVG
ncbi:hypothetical protein PIB30_038030 [Stylosanthes scabra]|uniref:Uncharacterized protein n=1 Tax=Stylosanthes scabra TaxID=79078 RepID=A0ABU6TE56_9FABA|nr:hypothetical protein [Stylosanthes scabra]